MKDSFGSPKDSLKLLWINHLVKTMALSDFPKDPYNTLGNNNHIWQFCKVSVLLPTFAVLWPQFHCGQNFQPMQFCGQGNKTAYLSSYTEDFRWSEKKNIKTANLGSYTDTFRLSENFVDHQNFHIEQLQGKQFKAFFSHSTKWAI